jgi:hypothetical protein
MYKNKWIYGPGFYFDADGSGGGGGGQNSDAQPPAGKTYTQEELDRMFGDRAKRAADAARADMLKDLGVDDPEALKALLKKQKEADDAQKSELQKVAEQLAESEKRAARLESDSKAQIAAIAERLMLSDVKMAASKAVTDKDGKTVRPAFRMDALDDLGLFVDRSLITEKDGKYEGIEKALESLAKAKPFLLTEAENGANPKGTPGAKSLVKKPVQQNQEQRPTPSTKSILN